MAKKSKQARTYIWLQCTETGDINYRTSKKSGQPKLELKKYSKRLRKHTVHKEKKK